MNFKNYSILTVDDDPSNLVSVADYLKDFGFKIITAQDGEMGLEKAKIAHPDLILLDVIMPKMDGFETSARLKADKSTAGIPIIFLTAQQNIDNKVKGFEVGGVDYITKPVQHAELLARITTHLRIQDLTKSLNAKLEELTCTRHELVQSEKMASLGRLVAGFTHEIGTPIGVAVGMVSSLQENTQIINQLLEQEEVDEDELFEALKNIDEAANLTMSNLKRAINLIHSFKRTAVDQTTEKPVQFEVKTAIKDVINTLHSKFKRTSIEIQVDCPDDLLIQSLPGPLEQIITNLMMNSLIHGFEEGKKDGLIKILVVLENEHLQINYSETGKGMTPDTLKKVFEPFFTTLPGKTGLGMYVCYNLVTSQLGGAVTCESTLGNGVLFKIDFPVG